MTSTEPVTATLRSVVDEDLVHAPVTLGAAEPMTALVPPGRGARLVLARAGGAGVAIVSSYDEDGELLRRSGSS